MEQFWHWNSTYTKLYCFELFWHLTVCKQNMHLAELELFE